LATGLERAASSLSVSLMTTTEDEEAEEAWEEGIAPALPVLSSVRAAGVVSFRSSDAVNSRGLSFQVGVDDSAMSPWLPRFLVGIDDSAMSPGLLRFQCRSNYSPRRSIDVDKTRLASTTSFRPLIRVRL
jgi:hypothetical protein